MDQDPGQVGARRVTAEGGEEPTPEQLRTEIEQTRAELGDTVEALAAKSDVKTRAREKADEFKRTATSKKDELVAKAKGATSGTGGSAGSAPETSAGSDAGTPGRADAARSAATSALDAFKATAQRNPVQTAAVGAFLGGILVGRGLGRR
ncbi:MAG TPA: DUF3618 domain-containing protein [Solirubrobacteraceae bacterium]|nr:DUF3618 domain-containing protein [Solirubrobacteraceae bacterium]